jgi:hypothetical protein
MGGEIFNRKPKIVTIIAQIKRKKFKEIDYMTLQIHHLQIANYFILFYNITITITVTITVTITITVTVTVTVTVAVTVTVTVAVTVTVTVTVTVIASYTSNQNYITLHYITLC